jgi:AraC family transcriptional regulator
VPATPEPSIGCTLGGSAEFEERESDGAWVTRQLQRGDIFITRSPVPYELRWSSSVGQELDVISIHLAVERFFAAVEAVYPGKTDKVNVIDFFGRDDALAHLCFACAEILDSSVPEQSKRVAALAQHLAAHLVEQYTHVGSQKQEFRGGLPIRQLRKVEDYVGEHLAKELSVQALAELVELSPFHFSRVSKDTTSTTPMQFVTQQRITRAQQLIRETSRSLTEIGIEVGYSNPSHFGKVFRKWLA